MEYPEHVKKPRLEYQLDHQPSFSRYLSNSFQRNQRHPILSDKKLIIYDLKVSTPELSLEYENKSLERLKHAMDCIRQNKPLLESQEVLYQLCENLCQYGKAQELFDWVNEECRDYIHKEFKKLSSSSQDGTEYLEMIHNVWKNYCDQTSNIRSLFLYLDRTWIVGKHGSFWTVAMNHCQERFKEFPQVWEKVLKGILWLIRSERSSQMIDEGFLQSTIRMLQSLELYSIFERHLLQETEEFYHAEGDRLTQSLNVFAYLEHVSTRVHQESILRVKNYFNKSSKSSLQSIVENALLTTRVDTILNACFDYFNGLESLEDGDFDKFSLLYRLLKKVGQLEICSRYFGRYVKTKGSKILTSGHKATVDRLMAFERQMDEVVDHSFEGDEHFLEVFKESLDEVINRKENHTIRTLTRYLDQALKHQDEAGLEKAIRLFRFIQGKDEFEIVYKAGLAKRLLLGLSGTGMERLMLSKIKKECGAGYTGKLEGMVKDMERSEALMKEYQVELAFELQVQLLTYGFWPSYSPMPVRLPHLFKSAQEGYQKFYMNKFDKRVLHWQNSLGVCEIHAHYPKGTKHITLTLLQSVVLLLFNDHPCLSYLDILKQTELDELELQRTLLSLSCREYKLLTKEPIGDTIAVTDQFKFNTEFETDKTKLSFITATLTEVIEKNSPLNTVLFAKEQQIDAVIVRIMKSKGICQHGQLLTEVTKFVRFNVTAQDIKKRIENLIEKEYLERGLDDTYTYLA